MIERVVIPNKQQHTPNFVRQPVVIEQQPPPSLEQRVVKVLDNANAGSDELAELVAETETAIAAADTLATALRLKAADVVAAPTPRDAQDAMREAEAAILNHDRLNGVLPQLRDRYTKSLKAERRAKWLGFYETAEAERGKLAHEIDATSARVKAELVSLNRRLKQFNRESAWVNDMGFDIGECREIEPLPLFAAVRTIDAGTSSSQPDWERANNFAVAFAQSMMPPPCDPARWSDPEQQAAKRAEIEKHNRETGEQMARMSREQEDRLNAEERERFAASRRAP